METKQSYRKRSFFIEKFNMDSISSSRSVIYGLSIIWVMLFHSSLSLPSLWLAPLRKVKEFGNCGVDVFLLVSGISLYFSFSKSNDIKSFYLRRLKRIAIPSLIVAIIFYVFISPSNNLFDFLLGITGIKLFTSGSRPIWYVTAISICYIIYPFVYKFFKKHSSSIWSLLILLFICFLANFAISKFFAVFWDNSEVLLSRIPIFLIGAYMGKYVYEKKSLRFTNLQMLLIAFALIAFFFVANRYLRSVIYFRYMFIPLSFGATILFSILWNFKAIRPSMGFLSTITLEIYLLNDKILHELSRVFPSMGEIPINIITFILSIALGFLLSVISKFILRFTSKLVGKQI